MNVLTSIVNEDQRLDEIELDAGQAELLTNCTTPVLSTPAVLTAAVATSQVVNAIW